MRILYVIGASQYDSTAMFMQEMEEYMRDAGWQTDLLDGRDEQEYEKQRDRIIQNQYDVIFTINGMLLEEDSSLGQVLLQNQNVIYCTYLMDHPLIHYQRLQTAYPYVFLLSPDRLHTAYTDCYLKNIWGTAFLPHAGCQNQGVLPYQQRNIDLSFMGSYIPLNQIRQQFQSYPREMCLLMETAADILVREPERTLEEAVDICFEKYEVELREEDVPDVLAEFRVVDRYIRSYYRDAVIRTLVEAGIRVDVYGDGWERFQTDAKEYLCIHPAVSYQESLDIISHSKISLNIMPWFKDGSHDRVFTAMLNGAICLTDTSAYLEEQLREREHVYFYSLKGLRYLPAKVRDILDHPEQSAKIAAAGRELALQRHTWGNRAAEVMEYLEQLATMKTSVDDTDLISRFHQEIVVPNTVLVRELARAIQYLRSQDYFHAMRRTTYILDRLGEVLPVYVQWKEVINQYEPILDEGALLAMMQEILDAQQRQDYVWLADLFALKLLPLIRCIQELYAGICGAEETGLEHYRIELTSSGAYTLAVFRGENWQYMHTNDNPYEEGRILAQSWFDGEHYDYVVYGLGLGYHIQALLDLDLAITVTVLEADHTMISLAEKYGLVKSWEQTGRVRIIADPDGTHLMEILSQEQNDRSFVIHYPSLGQIPDQNYRNQLEDYFIEYSSAQTQLPRLTGNFIRNRAGFQQEVSVLRDQFENKTVYIIAAGPSLDRNMHELKKVGDDAVILATGTVLKKLLAAGIQPDYVIVIDAGKTTYVQTKDVQVDTVPLLYLSTVYYQIPSEYPGEKYVILQRDYSKSEEFAQEHGYETYETGGSVMTTALDLCIRMGAACIVLVGADLAYTGHRNHAADTAYAEEVVTEQNTCMVEDVYGGQVMTAKNLNIYRRWIENRIRRETSSDIRFVDATEGGARIHGTKVCKLRDVIENGSV